MTKLLDLCSNDETLICWYRNALCSRAKALPDCPSGKLLSRKSTKGGSSITKYAKDCYILYMFLMGDNSCVSEIFDKNKSSSYVSDLNKINAVEIKTTIQLLVQKIASLENLVNSKDKTIISLTSDFNTLKSDFEQLQFDHDRLKGDRCQGLLNMTLSKSSRPIILKFWTQKKWNIRWTKPKQTKN